MKVQGKIFIVISIVLVLILIGWAVVKLMNQNKQDDNQTQDNRVFDKSITIGADKVVTTDQIRESFKDIAKDVGNAEASGVLVAQKGSLGEGVKYNMTMTKNNAPASVHVNKFTYDDEANLKKSLPISEEQGDKVEGIGSNARFYAFAPVAADWRATLMVVQDKSVYTFTLLQNYNEGIGITETAAKEALINLAKQAKFEDLAKSSK